MPLLNILGDIERFSADDLYPLRYLGLIAHFYGCLHLMAAAYQLL